MQPILFFNYRTRLLFELVMGLIFNLVITFTLFTERPFLWQGLVFTIVIFVVMAEGIFAFNQLLSRRYAWHNETFRRLILLLSFSILWFVIVFTISMRFKPVIEHKHPLSQTDFALSIIMAILFISIYVVILIAYNYHQSLSQFRIENERLKQEKLESDYRALQDQINPHFLFNNLSTLIAIIRQDKKAAIRFAENFSDVYRYVLESKNKTSVFLKDELTFINAYLALHKERLGAGLQLNINVDEALHSKQVPVLSLQFLVENAIKHNIATKDYPLKLVISGSANSLKVTNSRNPKESTYSTNTGLSNLQQRIAFLSKREMIIDQTETVFSVELPLI